MTQWLKLKDGSFYSIKGVLYYRSGNYRANDGVIEGKFSCDKNIELSFDLVDVIIVETEREIVLNGCRLVSCYGVDGETWDYSFFLDDEAEIKVLPPGTATSAMKYDNAEFSTMLLQQERG